MHIYNIYTYLLFIYIYVYTYGQGLVACLPFANVCFKFEKNHFSARKEQPMLVVFAVLSFSPSYASELPKKGLGRKRGLRHNIYIYVYIYISLSLSLSRLCILFFISL